MQDSALGRRALSGWAQDRELTGTLLMRGMSLPCDNGIQSRLQTAHRNMTASKALVATLLPASLASSCSERRPPACASHFVQKASRGPKSLPREAFKECATATPQHFSRYTYHPRRETEGLVLAHSVVAHDPQVQEGSSRLVVAQFENQNGYGTVHIYLFALI